jgi:hypothetical protein
MHLKSALTKSCAADHSPKKHQTKIKQKHISFCSLFVWSQVPKNGTDYPQCGHKPNKRLGRIVLTAP